jgi:hypothetical protein
MGIFTGSKKQDELVLVFNIGSSAVSGALFYTQKSGIPKIIFSTHELIPVEEVVDIDRFLSLTMLSLEIVVNKIFKRGLGAPAKIFCVLSSPWHASQTRIIRLEKNIPFAFTAKLAEELVQKEISLFEQEHFAEDLNGKNKIRSIEFKNIKTVLNGYETPNPLDQKAKELEMTIFISMSSEQVLKKIEGVIAKHFSFKNIRYSSFTMASFVVVRDMDKNNANFLLVDIGGEVTDISMVKKNVLCESVSFPLGKNFLTRGVASNLACSLNEASSLVSLFKDGHAAARVSKKLTPIILELKNNWLKKFQESLANLSRDISIPSKIYLTLDKDVADFFLETIRNEQFNQYTLTESKFELILLGTEILHGMAIFEENVIRDPSLVVDAAYINRLLI